MTKLVCPRVRLCGAAPTNTTTITMFMSTGRHPAAAAAPRCLATASSSSSSHRDRWRPPQPDHQHQQYPLGAYYASVMRGGDPITYASASPPVPVPPPPPSAAAANPESESQPPSSAAQRARIIFGSRLLGPAEHADRARAKHDRSQLVAGVLVPPRPEEPDNCCMSGCVNCVWERYREDVEEWTAKKREAAQAELAAQAQAQGSAETNPVDGGGAAAAAARDEGKQEALPLVVGTMKKQKDAESWVARQQQQHQQQQERLEEDVFGDVPLGIREFMKQEKRLKAKHAREGTTGG